MQVRRATPADDEGIAQLFAQYQQEFAYNLGDQDLLGEGRAARAYYRDAVWVAEDQGAVVGCVAYEPWGKGQCRMKRMYVPAAHRGKGIGRRLAQTAVEAARREGYKQMCLDTTGPMKAATALYKSMGFEEWAPDYDAPCIDTIYMRRML